MLNKDQRGTGLAETLCALAVLSIVLLAALRLLPLIQRQSHGGMQQARLARLLDNSLLAVEKDLRRAGYCRPPCQRPAVIVSQRRAERENSCVIASYAFYSAEARGSCGRLTNDTFGYRLHAGALETQRGVLHCNEPGWAKMHDPQQLLITQFIVEPVAPNAWRVTLRGQLRHRPDVVYRATRLVRGRNG